MPDGERTARDTIGAAWPAVGAIESRPLQRVTRVREGTEKSDGIRCLRSCGCPGTVVLQAPKDRVSLALANPPVGRVSDLPLGYLRGLIVLLVVAYHSALAYSGIPATQVPSFVAPPLLWRAFPIVDRHSSPVLLMFIGFNDAFFLSLMFSLSGLFVAPSVGRKVAAGDPLEHPERNRLFPLLRRRFLCLSRRIPQIREAREPPAEQSAAEFLWHLSPPLHIRELAAVRDVGGTASRRREVSDRLFKRGASQLAYRLSPNAESSHRADPVSDTTTFQWRRRPTRWPQDVSPGKAGTASVG